jgi:hypothetical protein
MYVAKANESPARAIFQWLMPSNADVILILTMGRSKRDGLLRANEDNNEDNHEQVSINSATGAAIILIDSHKCLLPSQSPAICYRNDEEPDVQCTASTGSGETH